MKAPKRGTQTKAAQAARRSAEGPIPTLAREKAHAQVAPKPAKRVVEAALGNTRGPRVSPRKLKPAPPVFDCLKCQKLAAEKREVARLRREVERLIGLDRARVAAALVGAPVTISDDDVAAHIQAAYAPAFAQVLQVPVEIALSCSEDAGDRLKAAAMITERIAGKVTDKVDHTTKGKALGGCALVCDFPVAGGPTPAAAPDPESGD